MGRRTAGDLMFESYLTERCVAVPEHEPDLGIGVRPEYLIEHDGAQCLVEVKQFAPTSWPICAGVTTMEEQLKPIRNQIHHAARKLREARQLRLPLVVVLTDPDRALTSLLGPFELISALRGDPMVVLQYAGAVDVVSTVSGRNGELRNHHPYVTAVVVVHELLGGGHWSQTYVTRSAEAQSLPGGIFDGGGDEVYDYSTETDTYSLTARGRDLGRDPT
jgi:hypothetical protein